MNEKCGASLAASDASGVSSSTVPVSLRRPTASRAVGSIVSSERCSRARTHRRRTRYAAAGSGSTLPDVHGTDGAEPRDGGADGSSVCLSQHCPWRPRLVHSSESRGQKTHRLHGGFDVPAAAAACAEHARSTPRRP